MLHTRTWHIDVQLSEDGPSTTAVAVLRTDVGTELRHTGHARRNPTDPDVAEIGDELATSRALEGLAEQLLDASWADVQANVTR